jgi:hypothetical protein
LALAIFTNVVRPDMANLDGSVLAEVRLLSTSAVYVTGVHVVVAAAPLWAGRVPLAVRHVVDDQAGGNWSRPS